MEKKKVGRPTKFDPAVCDQVVKYCKLGATDKQLAEFLEISEQTLNTWKSQHPQFLESIKEGKEIADAEVGSKLFHRATGYQHPDVHISNFQGAITKTPITKHYAPDTTAAIFWLKNRRPDLWRDRIEHTGKDGEALLPQTDVLEVARSIGFILSAATGGRAPA